MEEPSINSKRLIIIGNGFDLSLGLPTSYSSFLKDYLLRKIKTDANEIQRKEQGKQYNNSKLLVKINRNIRKNHIFIINTVINEIEKRITLNESFEDFYKFLGSYFEIHGTPFFENLISIRDNWTDIESFYFNFLFNGNHLKSDSAIQEINECFSELTHELIIYLKAINYNAVSLHNHVHLLKKLLDVSKQIESDDDDYYKFVYELGRSRPKSFTLKTEKTVVLNFNYTNSFYKLLDFAINQDQIDKSFRGVEIINIHGELDKIDSLEEIREVDVLKNIVFGYGDETSEQYKLLENHSNSSYLKRIKSSSYHLSSSYNKLNRFLNSINEGLEVYVVGHSLGLSDRVLLKEIFEHEKCKAIRIFHHNKEDSYLNTTLNITKHFSDKTKMRNRVVYYNELDKIPQK